MVNVGKWIARHRILILIISVILLIPSVFNMIRMRTNYDLLTYLPKNLETVQGEDIMVDEYGMGAFAMVVVEDMDMKDVQALKEKLEDVDHVKNVLWYDDLADISVPVDMIPKKIRKQFFNGDATMMIALIDSSTSSDESMQAVRDMKKIVGKQAFISGMTAVLNDTKDLADKEVPIYVGIAVVLSLIVLMCTTTSFVVPFLFLISIGFAILYNMGTNFFLGDISYVTKAVAAVLQLGVTMDYSIFLLNSFEENKQRFPGDKERAMGHAISNTFQSVIGSSVTTIAGFIALCFMTFTLGLDLGLVMAKGVIFGVICCITVLPSLVLFFDKLIDKTTHKPLLGRMDRLSHFITKHYVVWLVLFLAIIFPAVYGNNNVGVYYDITSTLPKSLDSQQAQQIVTDDFGTSTMHIIMMDKKMDSNEKRKMLEEISDVDGVTRTLGMNYLLGASVPDDMVPKELKNMLQSDKYEIALISTEYKVASDEINNQITEMNKIVKKYDKMNMVIGEGPLTKDLADVTDTDFKNVNFASIFIIFVIIMLVFRSISLPIILELVIEVAIFINMAIPYYTGTKIPFITSIILGTVQLGSTVDYAILMTSRYQKERQRGNDKKQAIRIAHSVTMPSVLSSALSFFAATFGVAIYSQIEIIKSMCMMLARGALISSCIVIFVLPSMFMLFDKVICVTSIDFLGKKKKKKEISKKLQKQIADEKSSDPPEQK